MSNEPTVKRWTAKRKAAVVMNIFKGKTTVTKVARENDLTVSEVESWIEEAQRNMENGFRSRPKDIREQYEARTSGNQGSIGQGSSADLCAKKVQAPAR